MKNSVTERKNAFDGLISDWTQPKKELGSLKIQH